MCHLADVMGFKMCFHLCLQPSIESTYNMVYAFQAYHAVKESCCRGCVKFVIVKRQQSAPTIFRGQPNIIFCPMTQNGSHLCPTN